MARCTAGRSAFGRAFKKAGRRGWFVRFRKDGREFERSGGPTKASAQKLLARAHAAFADGKDIDRVLGEVFGEGHRGRLSLKDAIPLYLEFAVTRKKASTLKSDRVRLEIVAEEKWAGARLEKVRRQDIVGFVDRLVAGGKERKARSGPTVNRYLAVLSALFRWAIRQGYVDRNPVREVDRQSERGRPNGTYLTAEEARELVTASSDAFRPLIVFALGTGCRRGEILALLWRDVDLARAEIHVRAENSKTHTERVVPLPEEVVGALKALRKSQRTLKLDRCDPVFQGKGGGAWTPQGIRYHFDKAVERCEKLPADKAGALRFHDLRHTYASIAVQNGVPIQTVSRLLGHSTLQTTMRYAHWSRDDRTEAARTVGSAMALPWRGAVS